MATVTQSIGVAVVTLVLLQTVVGREISRRKRQEPGIAAAFGVVVDVALSAVDTVQEGFAIRGQSATKLGINSYLYGN